MNLSAERVSVQSAALMMGINFTLICVRLLGLPRRLYRRAEDRQTDSVNAIHWNHWLLHTETNTAFWSTSAEIWLFLRYTEVRTEIIGANWLKWEKTTTANLWKSCNLHWVTNKFFPHDLEEDTTVCTGRHTDNNLSTEVHLSLPQRTNVKSSLQSSLQWKRRQTTVCSFSLRKLWCLLHVHIIIVVVWFWVLVPATGKGQTGATFE